MFVLDTDIVSLLHRGHDRVVARFSSVDEQRCAISIFTRMEFLRARIEQLFKAADGSQLLIAHERLANTIAELNAWLTLPVTEEVAAKFDELRQDRSLRKIGRADLLIGCTALAYRATLVTRNVQDFNHIPNLKIENWAD